MSPHDYINDQIRRQIIEATFNADHHHPVVNLCGALDGTRVEVFGEELGTYGFITANRTYDQARKAADAALRMLTHTLERKEG